MTNRLEAAETYTHTHTHTHTSNLLKTFIQIISVCFVFLSFSISSFSTTPDIPKTTTTASCADAILNTNGGNVNIEINWEPNVIPLRWYNGNTLVESNTCTYGGALTPPPPPAKTGYTFRGWRVRPQMDFSTLDKVKSGEHFWAKGTNAGGTDYCVYDGTQVSCNSDDRFSDLQQQEWKVQFSYGVVYGMARPSTQSGPSPNQYYTTFGEVTDTPGISCWCKATGYKPLNSESVYRPINAMPWMYWYGVFSKVEYSQMACARYCADNISSNRYYRCALYNISCN